MDLTELNSNVDKNGLILLILPLKTKNGTWRSSRFYIKSMKITAVVGVWFKEK
jgi:hypothetical protein